MSRLKSMRCSSRESAVSRRLSARLVVLRILICATSLIASSASFCGAQPNVDQSTSVPLPISLQFAERLVQHEKDTFESLLDESRRKHELDHLSFDPSQCKFVDDIRSALNL